MTERRDQGRLTPSPIRSSSTSSAYLRDKDTPTVHFRKLVNELTLLLTYEATKDFPTEKVEIETPLETMRRARISGKKVAVCPVLRAGVGMLDGVLSLVSSARVGFIGLYRDEETLEPVEYYVKLPTDLAERDAIVPRSDARDRELELRPRSPSEEGRRAARSRSSASSPRRTGSSAFTRASRRAHRRAPPSTAG